MRRAPKKVQKISNQFNGKSNIINSIWGAENFNKRFSRKLPRLEGSEVAITFVWNQKRIDISNQDNQLKSSIFLL